MEFCLHSEKGCGWIKAGEGREWVALWWQTVAVALTLVGNAAVVLTPI